MARSLDEILITPFVSADQDDVQNLILAGLQEHWGSIDPHKNADLRDIAASYASEWFLLAWQGNRVVGTGALVRIDETTAEIKRMSVSRELRRQGIGRLILHELLTSARRASFREVVLETTSTWQSAVDFYLKHGFCVTHCVDGDTYFRLELT